VSRKLKLSAAMSLAVGLMTAMSSGVAHAAGPTQICYLSMGVSANGVAPGSSVDYIFALGGAYVISGQYDQNGNIAFNGNWSAWWGYSTQGNYVIAGGRNDGSAPQNANGWVVITEVC
jgi:hypothetical protein